MLSVAHLSLRSSCLVLFIYYFFYLARSEELFPFDRLSPYDEVNHLNVVVPQSSELDYKLHRYEDTVKSQVENSLSVHRIRYLLGSLVRIDDPYYTLSVLEPHEPGGCQVRYNSAVRSTVSATANRRGCKVAVNAGYFSVTTGRCLGNIVSDGRIVQMSSTVNANFGIRHDGTIVVGYVPEEEVESGQFRQLVSGVIWLVRNGTNYVNESMLLESASNQDTGKMSTFVNVLSARTAIGHDVKGRVIVANVSIKTHQLWSGWAGHCWNSGTCML